MFLLKKSKQIKFSTRHNKNLIATISPKIAPTIEQICNYILKC